MISLYLSLPPPTSLSLSLSLPSVYSLPFFFDLQFISNIMFALRSIFAKELRRVCTTIDDGSLFFYICAGGAVWHTLNIIVAAHETFFLVPLNSAPVTLPVLLFVNALCFFLYNQVSGFRALGIVCLVSLCPRCHLLY
jgi:hypothetical protein